MQGKGIIKFFLVVVALMCFIQYFYLYPTYKVEQDAEKHATEKSKDAGSEQEQKVVHHLAVAAYLDSMGSEQVFKIPLLPGFTYNELKQKQLALGLDLKGGMSVVIQVDLREFIRNIANSNKDPMLEEATDNATVAQTGAKENYISLFADEFRKIAAKSAAETGKAPVKLAHKFFSKNEEIDFETSDAKVEAVLRQKANETVSLTYERLKDRIDQLGVVQPNINLDAARDLILVELPGVSNPGRVRSFINTTAKLEFWNVYRISDSTPRGNLANIFAEADAKLTRVLGKDTTEILALPSYTIDTTYVNDILGNDTLDAAGNKLISSIDTIASDVVDPFANAGVLLKKLTLNSFGGLGTVVMGTAPGNQINIINEYLQRPEIKTMFPSDLIFRWANKPMKFDEDTEAAQTFGKNTYELYAIKKDRGQDTAPIEGDRVTNASSSPNPQNGEIEVLLRMDGKGAKKWGEMTTACSLDKGPNGRGRSIAILLDNRVVSAPTVNEPILGGSSSISGGFSTTEAEDLAKMLQVGKLPANTSIIQENLVGPSLGKENINRSLSALLIGFGIVFLFMILYYGSGGFISILALFLNIFFIGGTLASLGTVLTLPGIAGIVLTIGMAVDANVIIYERIREELREGKTLMMAIKDGFQHSYSAIIDANVTTILVAGVLAYFGMGPIKGFAVVLIIGVISSLFTAVLVGRLMIEWWTAKGNDLSFWT
ncbi:MAG: SecD/SecF fusion protein, partial [Saprospiraceae bacterium]